ncbi:TetR/AcrR family transcriptional regulator [Nocardioides sp. GXZ039]|uniref:TetR/AcrR family transcriptional regulator n=1 Tax=Nocardioides sp. GXZ039 TaxID=3136018 RepID=UPI0030F42E94
MGRRPDIDGRELLLAAGLKLFSEHGLDAVSIRAVTREAGLGPAAVHYHFVTKEALVEAVLERYGGDVVERVRERAKELAASGAVVDGHGLVTVMIEPYLELMASRADEGLAWVRLMAQVLQQSPDRLLEGPSMRAVRRAAALAYPEARPADVRRALRMCLILLIGQLATMSGRRRSGVDIETLIEFLAAGLDATLGARARATA